MRYKVRELEGALLDAAVAIALGDQDLARGGFTPSTRWHDGGPIIERERICVIRYHGEWGAHIWPRDEPWCDTDVTEANGLGPTPLIAAMRAYVANKFGEEIDLPD